jgi:type IV pilus assembly protein PilV
MKNHLMRAPGSVALPARHAGFTLLEVLVAIVVLSFGMLGVVGLQAASLQANKEARNQSASVRLARELSDLMRGNKDTANNHSSANNPYIVDYTGTLPSADEDCYAITCTTAAKVAAFQVREWLSRATVELPGLHAKICYDKAPYDADGMPQWDCDDTGGAGVAVVKIGWTRMATDRGLSASSAATGGLDRASRPGAVVPLIAGS